MAKNSVAIISFEMTFFGLDCQDYIIDHQQKKIDIDLSYTDIFLTTHT